MFITGDVPPFAAWGVDPKLLRRVPYCLRHQAALECDPAKVLQMVEVGEGLRADQLSGRDQAGRAAWGRLARLRTAGAGVEGHRGSQPGGRARYVDTLRAAFDVPPGLCEWPVYYWPSTTFPLAVRLGARPEVSDEPDRLVSG